jgi:hypothetical protein
MIDRVLEARVLGSIDAVYRDPIAGPDDAADGDGFAFGKADRHLTGPNSSGDPKTM